jgi:tRNA threonylcarbamoyladenosine modification (KEOPS) complex Cgi121 subunit
MTKTIAIPEHTKEILRKIAAERQYPLVLEILARGQGAELVLADNEEAQAIVNVARLELLDAMLRYPFWSDDSSRYDEAHAEAFHEVMMGFFEKVASYIDAEFDIEAKV